MNQNKQEGVLRSVWGPAWRWRHADFLAVGDSPKQLQRADPLVQRTVNYLQLNRRLRAGELKAAQVDPAIASVDALQTDRPQVDSLKIMALAGCPPEEIGVRLGLAPEIVATWEQLFFDVREMRPAVAWVESFVLAPERQAGRGHLAARLALAATGGPIAAQAILDIDHSSEVDMGQRLFKRKMRLDLKAGEALAMPLNSARDSLDYLEIYTEFVNEQRRIELGEQKLIARCQAALQRHERELLRLKLQVAQAQAQAEEPRDDERAADARAATAALARLQWGTAELAPAAALSEKPEAIFVAFPSGSNRPDREAADAERAAPDDRPNAPADQSLGKIA